MLPVRRVVAGSRRPAFASIVPTDVLEPTEEAIIGLLRDPNFPTRARVAHGGTSRSGACLHCVRPVARYATGRVEELTDACVARLEGRRHRVIDPWSWLPNIIRRATGGLPSSLEDVWVLPRDVA
jgi:hypothetical protein